MRGLDNSQILDIDCDNQGNVWLASENNGLFVKWRNRNSFEVFYANNDNPNALSSNNTYSIFNDSKGNVWVGTVNMGLNLYKPAINGFEKFTTENGLLDNCVNSVLEDNQGNLWAISPNGMSMLRQNNGQYQVVYKYPLLKKRRINHLAAYLNPKTNVLYLGSNDGLIIIEIEDLIKKTAKPTVYISRINLHNTASDINTDSLMARINNSSAISYHWKNNLISFDLASSVVSENYSNEFAYKLEGFDDEWNYLSNKEHTITYNGLPEGSYKLIYKTKTCFSEWSEERTLVIRIEAPLWEQSWFTKLAIVLATLLLVGTAVLLIRQMQFTREKERLMQEKHQLEIVQTQLSHELSDQASELMITLAEVGQKKSIIQEIQNRLREIQINPNANTAKDLKHLAMTFEQKLEKEENWDVFRKYFDQMNQDFSQRLIHQFPQLTPNEIRLCIFIRLNMSTYEIAQILNITPSAVHKSRFRLKKNMALDKNTDLDKFVSGF
jgi:hypothetical protein